MSNWNKYNTDKDTDVQKSNDLDFVVAAAMYVYLRHKMQIQYIYEIMFIINLYFSPI